MTLQEKLNNLKAKSEKRIPKEILTIMHRATKDLINSGIMDGVVKTKDTAPDIELIDNGKKVIHLKDYLSRGPVVLSFYRGKW